MERPLAYLKNLPDNWLIGYDSRQFQQTIDELYSELTQLSQCGKPPKVILAEQEPVQFLAGFTAACAAHCPVFLCNPNWVKLEWEQVMNLVQPDVIWNGAMRRREEGERGRRREWGVRSQELGINNLFAPPLAHSPLIMIPTGGSSGQIKFAMHTWETLMASVKGFKEYFSLNKINSFCVLPLYHVSGLMQFMRSFSTGGQLALIPFKEIEFCQKFDIQPSQFFISLVPTQLQRLLQNRELTRWLSQFQTVLLGGAPAWNELLEKAKYHQIRLAPTYGMTETASQIATLKPEEFLSGKISAGKVLPHAEITIHNEQGEVLPKNEIGKIRIQAQSLAVGYYGLDFTLGGEVQPLSSDSQAESGNQKKQGYLQVDDLGFKDDQDYLTIVGRSSDKIITGGENVYPTEIESAIRGTGMVEDVCVIGIPDKFWGQAVTAIYIPNNSHISILEIQSLLRNRLTNFKIPKNWIAVQTLPRNSQGKINRQQLQEIALENSKQEFMLNHGEVTHVFSVVK